MIVHIDRCEFQACMESHGAGCITTIWHGILVHLRCTCGTFYCPHPERMCGVRASQATVAG